MSLMTPLLSYLIAGARLTGCVHGYLLGNDGRNLRTPAGEMFYTSGGRPGWPGDESAGLYIGRRWAPVTRGEHHVTLGEILEAWQPDRESSVSRQHFIDTGLYLPIGSAQRELLGVQEESRDAGWEHPAHLPGVTISTFIASGPDTLDDGALVVQIDTEDIERVRINLNDTPVWSLGEQVYGEHWAGAYCEDYRARPYVNVNEDGVEYDSHATLAAAQAVQRDFPNDTIEIRTHGLPEPRVASIRRRDGSLSLKPLTPVPGDTLREEIPEDDVATCGACGRSWDDGQSTGVTPTPAGRCPFEGECA